MARCFWRLIPGAILVIAWLNLTNDAFDAETGVDQDKAESVVCSFKKYTVNTIGNVLSIHDS